MKKTSKLKDIRLGMHVMDVIVLFPQGNIGLIVIRVTTSPFAKNAIKIIPNICISLRKLRMLEMLLLPKTTKTYLLKATCFVLSVMKV